MITAATEDRRIRAARMTSLLLDDRPREERTVAGVVEWFGAMQGQDLASVMWSLGLRTGRTRDEVGAAFESGEILRTWPMRGTLHVVPGADARWMIAHLGARALRGAEARRQFLGLAEEDADRAAAVLRDALGGGRIMTRAECVSALEAEGIPGAGQRAYHLLWYASQKGVTCVGPQRGKDQTFVLLDEFAPPGPDLDRPRALAVIAERFVRSHAPVSAHDLARWADLTVTDARAGLAAADGVVPRTFGGRDLFVTEALLDDAVAGADPPQPCRPVPCPGSTSSSSATAIARPSSMPTTRGWSSQAATGSSRTHSSWTVTSSAPGGVGSWPGPSTSSPAPSPGSPHATAAGWRGRSMTSPITSASPAGSAGQTVLTWCSPPESRPRRHWSRTPSSPPSRTRWSRPRTRLPCQWR